MARQGLYHLYLLLILSQRAPTLQSQGQEDADLFDDVNILDMLDNFGDVDPKIKVLSACHSSTQLQFDSTLDTKLWLKDALRAFRECGVVALESAVPLESLRAIRQEVVSDMRPLLASRSRIRQRLRQAMASRESLRALWDEEMRSEDFFLAGSRLKERNDGRIDLTLPFREPFNASEYVAPKPVMQMLSVLLGSHAELKGMHAIYAQEWQPFMAFVPGSNFGTQHWHRDTGLLFESMGDDDTYDEEAAAFLPQDGAYLPPYAVNVFTPLEDVTKQSGPTEFTLGSHLWGSDWTGEEDMREQRDIPITDRKFYLPAGTAILADYRVLHRGTRNEKETPRILAMNIWGRDWWTDTVNYGKNDFGGFSAPVPGKDGESDIEKRALWGLRSQAGWASAAEDTDQRMAMFWGLVNTVSSEACRFFPARRSCAKDSFFDQVGAKSYGRASI